METMEFEFSGGRPAPAHLPPALVGVVASGNLEVLVEQASLGGSCRIDVRTPVSGFAGVWRSVLEDFHGRHAVGDIRVSINDMGASPAVVTLRLDQALEDFLGEAG